MSKLRLPTGSKQAQPQIEHQTPPHSPLESDGAAMGDPGSSLVLADASLLQAAPDRIVEAADIAPSLPFLVVGIGIGTGGLQGLNELLKHLTPQSGLALVLIPIGEMPGLLTDLIADKTPLPVQLASAGRTLLPNHVYVAPDHTAVRIEDGALVLSPRPPDASGLVNLDGFLRSLAADLRSRAVGIVLSGCATDATLGLKAIKDEGGITIVLSDSTKADGLQRSANLADYIDLALRAEQIGQELGRIAKQLDRLLFQAAESAEKTSDEHALAKIYTLLRKVTGVDFSFYKQTTLRRRIARRMVVKRITTLQNYARHLQSTPAEIKELYEDMLISVTGFFRDPETFDALRKDILPQLMRDRSAEQPIRIWVPGCATGEEVYSLAITLLEHLGSLPFETTIQIFGTDISDRSIDRARTAVYSESLVSELSPDRRRRFFTQVEGGYQVVKRLRDLCVFARQNLASDPPFSRLDLISCRNVLIYLGPTLQKTIIPTFHYALKSNGFLLLGNSETIRDYSNLFILLDKRHKFYAKNPTLGRTALALTPRTLPLDPTDPSHHERTQAKEAWSEIELQRAADRIILARLGPAGVIINERAEILQSRGHTSPFLELPSGSATLNLLRMVKENIALELRDGISRALADDIPVRLEGLRLPFENRNKDVTIDILPIQSHGRNTRCFLVLFIPGPELVLAGGAPLALLTAPLLAQDDKDKEILQLRNDLAATKLYLQSLLEERDIANQELISANEEIQSSNEELQSINEELETAKEELQSTNEELQTVNEELSNRNLELGQTSNDLLNLLNNITIPVLMLGSDLRIRQFTPIAERLMNLRAADIGRPIGEIRLNLHLDDLEPMLVEVIETLTTKELEVKDRAGRWHLLRARPYRTADNKIEGVVLVLVDIDQIRKSQQELVEARDFAQAVISGAQVPLVALNRELRMKLANRAFLDLCGLPSEEVEGRLFHELAARHFNLETIRPLLENLRAKPGGQPDFELEHELVGPSPQILRVHARAIFADGELVILVALQNITAHKLAERLLQREKERLQGEVIDTERALDHTQEELRALAASLFTAQEEERRRVARELHDDLAQKVALLDLNTERLQQGLLAVAPNLRGQVDTLRQHITDLSVDLRRIAYQLHPTILDDLGLSFAIKQLGEEFAKRENIELQFSGRSSLSVPPAIGGALYRIAQEALRNIVKHAGKTRVKISLTLSGKVLRLEVRDYGQGFTPALARGGVGMGILNMEERARLAGGSFALTSQPGKGVFISVRVPLPQVKAR